MRIEFKDSDDTDSDDSCSDSSNDNDAPASASASVSVGVGVDLGTRLPGAPSSPPRRSTRSQHVNRDANATGASHTSGRQLRRRADTKRLPSDSDPDSNSEVKNFSHVKHIINSNGQLYI